MTTTNFIKASLLALLTITLYPVKLILSAFLQAFNDADGRNEPDVIYYKED